MIFWGVFMVIIIKLVFRFCYASKKWGECKKKEIFRWLRVEFQRFVLGAGRNFWSKGSI